MKDLPLSLLSRGCGRLVSSSGGAGGRDGRLDVCFTPQDYDVCKARETLLRLSSSGRLFAEAASTIPKTYSTRRGALLLYSQELVTMETSYRPDLGARKKKVIRRDTQQMKQRLSSLKELTAAILSYSNNQSFSSRLAPPLFPPLSLPPTLHHTSPASTHTTEAPASPGLLVHLNPQWLPANQNAAWETQAEGNKDEQDSERVRVDVFLHMPRTSRTPTPQPWVHYVPQEQQSYRDDILQHAEGNHHLMGDGVSHPNIKGVHDKTECEDASIPDDRNPGDNDGGEKSISRTRHGSRGKPKQQMTVELKTNAPSGLLLRHQEVSRSVFDGLRWEEKAEPRCEVSSPDEHRPHRLPPIAEGGALTPQGGHAETRPDARAQGDGARVQSQENVNRLNKQPLVLPLLFPETDETKQRKGREKTKRQRFQVGGVGKEGGGRLPSGKGSAILLEPDEEPSPPVGVLGCVAGWKGPGKQSSLAFLQNHEPSDATRGLVRGVLPLELRDFQSGKSAGCLILGPDGEIIQVSLNDTSRDASQGDGDSRHQALQVLSTEGEELPWVIVLQTQPADTGGELELSTCVLQSHTPQSTHRGLYQGTESHLPRGHCASGELTFSTEQLSDLHSSTETNTRSPRGHTDAAMVGKKKTKSAEQVLQTRKGAKNRTRMPPLKEQGGKEELRGSSADEEDEELSLTEHMEHLYESHHKRNKLQNISPRETPPKDADKWRTKKVTEGDAVTAGKREASPEESPESNEQRRRKMKEEKWQKPRNDDVQSVRILRHDGSTSGEAAETQDQSAPSHKKRIKNRERRRGEMRMNEEREDQGAVRQTVSVGRRRKRRGGQKHKELIAENPQNAPENEGAGIQQEMPADAHRPSTSLSSAAPTQRSDATTEEDTDELLTSDKRSCIQSESSLRSTVPSSQRQPRSSVRSLASFSERTVPASVLGLASSHGRLSSCSTVMVTEEQLMLNPVKPEFPRPTNGEEEEEAAALRLAQRAERRRQEVERKRRQREEEERKQQEKEQTEDRMKNELEEERRKRAEDLRLKKLAEEEERRRREEEEQERARREQAQKERERRRQEEMRRQLEQLHQIRKQEEQRRKAELERLRLEEEKKQEEENQRLQQMDEAERTEYLHRKEQEEKERKKEEEERTRREQEAASLAAEEERLQAELLARQMALLQQQLVSERDFMLEAGGLEKTQGISRPWIYSYFTLFQLLGSNPVRAESQTP